MIKEVKKFDVKHLKIFPKMDIKTEIGDGFVDNTVMIRSYVSIDNYLIRLATSRTYSTDIGIDYVELMLLIDNYMILVNDLKKNFKPSDNTDILGILKIIE